MKIIDIEAISLSMHYRPDLIACVQRSGLRMNRGRMTPYRVELEGGAVGYGDGIGDANDVGFFVGQNALRGLAEIRHGGVQMALYDEVGQSLRGSDLCAYGKASSQSGSLCLLELLFEPRRVGGSSATGGGAWISCIQV